MSIRVQTGSNQGLGSSWGQEKGKLARANPPSHVGMAADAGPLKSVQPQQQQHGDPSLQTRSLFSRAELTLLCKFAIERGGIGLAVARHDRPAEALDDLMWLEGDVVTVLFSLGSDASDALYLGYCQGVLGLFREKDVVFPKRLKRTRLKQEWLQDFEKRVQARQHLKRPQQAQRTLAIVSASLMPHTPTSMVEASGMKRISQEVLKETFVPSTTMINSASVQSDLSTMSGLTSLAVDEDEDEDAYDGYVDDPRASRMTGEEKSGPTMDHSQRNLRQDAGPSSMRLEDLRIQDTSRARTPLERKESLGKLDLPQVKSRSKHQFGPSISSKDYAGIASTSSPDVLDPLVQRQSILLGLETDEEIDEFGFLHSRNQLNPLTNSPAVSGARHRSLENKWLALISSAANVERLPARSGRSNRNLKHLCRLGIPDSLRARVWPWLACADLGRKEGFYQRLTERQPLEIYDVIDRDINRSYPDNIYFRAAMAQRPPPALEDLQQVLYAYAQLRPEVGYTQGMGRLVGCLLLQMPAEAAFWTLVRLVESGWYMAGYYAPGLKQLKINASIFAKLLQSHEPKVARHLEQFDIDPLFYLAPWHMSLFTSTLPWNTVIRLWDAFLLDGTKLLLRMSLAIFTLLKKDLLEADLEKTYQLVLHPPLHLLTVRSLFNEAFQIKLKRSTLRKLSEKCKDCT